MFLPNNDYFFILNQDKPIGVIRILTDRQTAEGKVSQFQFCLIGKTKN